jgi:hypothetical protein
VKSATQDIRPGEFSQKLEIEAGDVWATSLAEGLLARLSQCFWAGWVVSKCESAHQGTLP